MRFEITEKCVSCLACVRVCPSQAIAVDGDRVRIVDESCIRAGACVPACPHDAIDAVGDPEEARALAERDDTVLILSVEADVYFYPHTPEQVVNACYALGFRRVFRGVVGDELVAEEYRELFEDPQWGTMLRSTCPVVVERVRRDYPELLPYLAPVKTPLEAEADYVRRLFGDATPLVYAGVCVAQADRWVDAVVTFDELAEMFRLEGIEVASQPRLFDRLPEVRQRRVSTAGGLPLPVLQGEPQTSRRFRKVRGLDQLGAMARAVAVDGVDLGFVDILPCEGCLDHPLLGPREGLFWRRRVAEEAEPVRSRLPVVDPDVLVTTATAFQVHVNGTRPPVDEVARVIDRIGRTPEGRPWDCRACGYASCEEFAGAYIKGRASLRQCPPHQELRAVEAEREAAVDSLTGLATFRVLRDRLTQEIARSDRSREPFAVVFVDLDRFKPVNDVFGHEVGNQVLAAVGRKLRGAVRQTDIAARYGGDEFVLVLVRTDLDGARRVGEVLRQSVEAVGREGGFEEGVITASVGVAAYDPAAGILADVLEMADKWLYRAKEAGGNRVMVMGDES